MNSFICSPRLMPNPSMFFLTSLKYSALDQFNKQKNSNFEFLFLNIPSERRKKTNYNFTPFIKKGEIFWGNLVRRWWEKIVRHTFAESTMMFFKTLLRHLICKLMEWGICFFSLKGEDCNIHKNTAVVLVKESVWNSLPSRIRQDSWCYSTCSFRFFFTIIVRCP